MSPTNVNVEFQYQIQSTSVECSKDVEGCILRAQYVLIVSTLYKKHVSHNERKKQNDWKMGTGNKSRKMPLLNLYIRRTSIQSFVSSGHYEHGGDTLS
jgi:hypothetical protein